MHIHFENNLIGKCANHYSWVGENGAIISTPSVFILITLHQAHGMSFVLLAWWVYKSKEYSTVHGWYSCLWGNPSDLIEGLWIKNNKVQSTLNSQQPWNKQCFTLKYIIKFLKAHLKWLNENYCNFEYWFWQTHHCPLWH